ncbi:hypothetical protein LEP1GSC103_3269 [Leptospira borgpetersenii serovar Javanica str. UI 09931]|uniref:Uncharacterized protein n=1 Tax=Leptospira borgpetersenii serovar Javanica str. UI 09931 TaxID=1049767 RepID=A0AAV3JDP5_LEPBO|nr:hypothetical protein C4Q31_03430 [Leptospira borgpetersenii serovar Ceylonica]EKQ90689.1 hypothetical protein LEP1GSC101_0707 [Leptospira borgpetersenii str. UI 09149]EMN58760.1 hypothetical protein LEP1GSC090_0978 [Leptospira borgpetersenii serovar Javanica str. MK146]EPG58198.1 hypothetical protein LEP1GSC103_3269 [Leptospira borgpetersenii serovar Javanica str. UI 09931]
MNFLTNFIVVKLPWKFLHPRFWDKFLIFVLNWIQYIQINIEFTKKFDSNRCGFYLNPNFYI